MAQLLPRFAQSVAWAIVVLSTPLWAQESPTDPAQLQELLERVRELEAQVQELQSDGDLVEEGSGASAEAGEDEGASGDDSSGPYESGEEPEKIELSLPRSMKLTLGGQLRLRGELRDPADYRLPGSFGRSAADDPDDATNFVLMRTRINFDLQVHERLRAFVELQDSRTFGDVRVAQDRGEIHLHQGFVELQPFDVPLEILAGRWQLPDLGDQRLMARGEFHNVSRSWDGFSVTYHPKGLWIQGFASNIAEGAVLSPDGDGNDDQWFTGLYVSLRALEDHEFDVYLFWRYLNDRSFTSEVSAELGDRVDFTYGFRFKGKAAALGYSGEVVMQTGDQAGDRIQAWAAAAKTWFTLGLGGSSLVFIGEYVFASGDSNPTDGKQESFDPLWPAAHKYLGHQDLFGWRNVHSGLFGLSWRPLKGLSLNADAHVFWLHEKKDAWYKARANPVRQDASGGSASYVGSELDLYLKYTVWEHLHLKVGYSHFWAGAYVRHTALGNADDGGQDWWHLTVEVRF